MTTEKKPVGRPPLGPPEPIPDSEANIIKVVVSTRKPAPRQGWRG